ncbi:MAG: ankyrin repeat domain-containing protein [Myxococcales bacterium]|nr:ankyrin repeat domain-containing protein [Myxococcales bacterium]
MTPGHGHTGCGKRGRNASCLKIQAAGREHVRDASTFGWGATLIAASTGTGFPSPVDHSSDLVGWTPLHEASHRGDAAQVEALLASDADVGGKTVDGYSALHICARHGTAAVAKMLLDAGADPNDPIDRYQRSATVQAAWAGNAEVLGLLRERGGQLDEAAAEAMFRKLLATKGVRLHKVSEGKDDKHSPSGPIFALSEPISLTAEEVMPIAFIFRDPPHPKVGYQRRESVALQNLTIYRTEPSHFSGPAAEHAISTPIYPLCELVRGIVLGQLPPSQLVLGQDALMMTIAAGMDGLAKVLAAHNADPSVVFEDVPQPGIGVFSAGRIHGLVQLGYEGRLLAPCHRRVIRDRHPVELDLQAALKPSQPALLPGRSEGQCGSRSTGARRPTNAVNIGLEAVGNLEVHDQADVVDV